MMNLVEKRSLLGENSLALLNVLGFILLVVLLCSCLFLVVELL